MAPVAETAGNFLRAVPVALGLAVIEFTLLELRALPWDGILLALLSGALTSGLGYTLWYATLPHLTSTTSGVVQLTVPVLAAALGALLLAEPVTLRLGVASGLILGGVAVATLRGAGSRSNE
jgi:drug/metabolite transporter (DMT)-like permease